MRSHTEVQHGLRDHDGQVAHVGGSYTPEGVYTDPETNARAEAARTGKQYVRRHVATTTYPWEPA